MLHTSCKSVRRRQADNICSYYHKINCSFLRDMRLYEIRKDNGTILSYLIIPNRLYFQSSYQRCAPLVGIIYFIFILLSFLIFMNEFKDILLINFYTFLFLVDGLKLLARVRTGNDFSLVENSITILGRQCTLNRLKLNISKCICK